VNFKMKNHIIKLLLFLTVGVSQQDWNIKFMEEYGGLTYSPNSNKPYTGKVFDLYKSNGNKKVEGYYKDGLRNRKWEWWSEDGKMDSSGTYKIGIKDGKWIHSTEIGNGKYEVRYTTGNIDLATFTDNLGQTYSGIPVNEEPKADGQYLGQEHEYNFSIYPEIYIYPF
jgi:antitoxin component YwqK of YwqJK toxin-antitoxin module